MVSLGGSQLKRETPVPSSSSDFELPPVPSRSPVELRLKAQRPKGSKAYAEPRDVRCKDHNQNVQGETRLSKMKRQQNATASKAEAKHGQGCNEFRKFPADGPGGFYIYIHIIPLNTIVIRNLIMVQLELWGAQQSA